MSRKSRKPRPLNRDIQTFRDDTLYIVACDDTYAPEQYFKAYQQDFMGTRLQVKVVETPDGSSAAEHVLNRLLQYEVEDGDQRWLLLDTDHYADDSHRKGFLQALKRARQEGVRIALNKPCFEFWLILHHLSKNESRLSGITDAASAVACLKSLLGGYNKRKLDMNHFSIAKVSNAFQTAKEIDTSVAGGDIPDSNTARTYLIWEEMIRNASSAQLPSELLDLKKVLT